LELFISLNNKLKQQKYVKFIRDKIKRLTTVSLGYPSLFEVDKFSNIVICAPHPDDEVIGLGGYMWQSRDRIKDVLIFTNGNNKTRVHEASLVARETGVSYRFVGQNNRIDEKESYGFLKQYLDSHSIDLLIFPSVFEIHIDHYILFEICRKLIVENKYTFSILLYEVWNTLLPNYIIDITNYWNKKEALINFYISQVNEFDYVMMAQSLNKFRGMIIKKQYGEGVMFFTSAQFREVFK
jgi:LmbE family N-acetylglucosaminyl deacetylase